MLRHLATWSVVNELYKKYSVDSSFYKGMSDCEFLDGLKDVLHELELKKCRPFDKEDLKTIKELYSAYSYRWEEE